MSDSSHWLIRGARIEQQLEREIVQLEERSYQDLEVKTKNFAPPASPTARQNAVGPIQVQKLQLIPARQSGSLEVKALVSSKNSKYNPSLQFDKVIFDDSDQSDNTSFKGVDGQEYHIVPIPLAQSNVKVQCNCLDFYYRFAQYNSRDGSLLGQPPPPYQRKTMTRPPANIQKTPGVCKHIMKAIVALKGVDIVR
jgi:hypothetical protein